jgi:hypothetical protein
MANAEENAEENAMAKAEQELREALGHMNDLSVALHSVDRQLGKLVEIARFQVAAESGIDPLAHTLYSNDSEAGEEEDPSPPDWIAGR